MPALCWLGRRWRWASDDFVFNSVLYFVSFGVIGALIASQVTLMSDTPDRHRRLVVRRCPEVGSRLTRSYLGLGCTNLVLAVSFLLLALMSARGAIFEESKRWLVPHLMTIVTLGILVAFVLSCMCVKYALYDAQSSLCSGRSAAHIMHGVLVLDLFLCLCFLISLLVMFDLGGRSQYTSTDEYAHVWWKRFRVLCCLCWRKQSDEAAFKDAALIFGSAFRGYDLVLSDIIAGMLLLHGYQHCSRRIISQRVHYIAGPPCACETISSQACLLRRPTLEQRCVVQELASHARFYMAAYGWLLYQYRDCCSLPHLCCFDPCICCRDHAGVHYGQNYRLDVVTLLKETGLPEEDVLLTSWNNSLFKPVYYVALDRSTNAVVIAVRGTMSFIDCITDLAASPVYIDVNDDPRRGLHEECPPLDQSPYYVHGGMYHSATYLLRCLEYNNILHSVVDGCYADRRVTLVGHSLGAGVVMALSVLLWSSYPELRPRLRCLAYAPPGAVFSKALMEYTSECMIGCFAGYDVIPRISQHTFDFFRESLFDVMAASPVSKTRLFLNSFRTEELMRPYHPSSRRQDREGGGLGCGSVPGAVAVSEESAAYREALRHHPCVPPESSLKLYACQQMVHFRKAVTRDYTNSPWRCGDWHESIYVPSFESPMDLQMVLSSPTMVLDHFPDRLFKILADVQRRLERGELERFFVDYDPPSISEQEAPMRYVPIPTEEATCASV